MKSMLFYILLASQHNSFVYGFLEHGCSNGPCTVGISQTASGDLLSHNIPSAAIPIPKKVRLIPRWVWLKVKDGKCTKIKINDRTSTRLIHKRGFDLSPAALKALTGKISRHWSGKVTLCEPDIEVGNTK